ncbi:MAG: hypothetical protein QM702_20770 [Rubrivivax sp.]
MGLERLGYVESRSGVLTVVDFGLLGAWTDAPCGQAARAALAQRSYAFEHAGVPAVAVPVPPNRELAVMGLRFDDGELQDLWQAVYVDVVPNAQPARTIEAGRVIVDEARIGFFDLDALAAWRHDEPLDGKADVVFWGLHGREVAQRFSAPHDAEEDVYGWKDMPLPQAHAFATQLDQLRASGQFRFAFDLRPHSHHYIMMKQVRSTETESGMLGLGRPPSACCGLSTTWGDGEFPVMLDFDAQGQLTRLGVFFATESAIDAMRAVNS